MRVIKKIPINRIFSKVYNDFGFEEIDEDSIVEWTGDVLSHIEIDKAYVERVAFLDIREHQAELPDNIISILRVAKNNRYEGKSKYCQEDLDCLNMPDVLVKEGQLVPCIENLPVITNCNTYTEFPCGEIHRKPNITFDYPYYNWIDSNTYSSQFSYMSPASDSFRSSLICEMNKEDSQKLYKPGSDEYQLIEGRYIRTSFREGQIAVAYLSQPIDLETGYPLIPDDISVISAITNYILFMYCRRLHIMGRPGYKEKYQQAEADYHWYLSQAKNKLHAPHGIDEFQEIAEARYSFLPNLYKYSNRSTQGSLRRFAQDDINSINRRHG